MPAGNDQAAAVADLISKGGYTTNVEELIAAANAAVSPELQAASMRALDPDASKELDWSSAEVPDGHTVLSGAVRGDKVAGQAAVFVVADPAGRTYKHVQGYSENWAAPERTADETAEAASASARAGLSKSIADAAAEAEKELEAALADIETKKAERIAEAQAAADAEVEAAVEAAADDTSEEKPETAAQKKKREAAEKKAAADKTS